MTITFGFFNSVNSDRLYSAEEMSRLFDGVIRDGIFSSIGSSMMVVADTGLIVNVGEGRAWFNHTWTLSDALLPLELDPADMINPRIDAIVLEVNADQQVRANSIKIVDGTPASSPVPPTLINSGDVHQYPLAYISIPVGLTTILANHITNKVGSSDCPFVIGPLTIVTTDELIAQWEAEFITWFDEMKDHLSGDIAGELQLQINDIEDGLGKITARQGGSATVWNLTGTNDYLLPALTTWIQVGNLAVINNLGTITVTFPVEFKYPPVVFITPDDAPGGAWVTGQVISAYADRFTAKLIKHTSGSPYHALAPNLTSANWMAIGEHI